MAKRDENKAGTYVEATLDTIGEGDLREAIEEAIRDAYRGLEEWERRAGERSGKAKVAINIELSRNSEQFLNVKYDTKVSTPKIDRSAFVKGAGGRLLVNPEGDSLNDKDQLVMTFDGHGGRRASINRATGEVVAPEEEDAGGGVAGKVGAAG